MRRLVVVALVFLPLLARAAPDPLATEAERSGFRRTGRYEEVERLCAGFAAAHPKRVRCETFGRTPEGRPMLALVASAEGTVDAARARPVLLIQGGIHAGEIEGKDALFQVLREVLAGTLVPGLLDKVTLVLVPVFNVDGHERFGPGNRPNQRGPEEMGFRTTAQNLNLNRDYVKAEAPEMQAMLALWEEWDPTVYVDLHTTDGAKFEHDVSVALAPDIPRPDGLDKLAAGLGDALQARLVATKHLPLAFYPSFRVNDDPASGFEVKSTEPRFSHAYAGARNRIGILVETHSWKTYRERVATTRDVLAALFERAHQDAAAWRAAVVRADEQAGRIGGTDVVLMTAADGTSRTIEFRGYAYTVAKSELSGRSWIAYDETRPQIWRLPLYDRQRPELTVHAPRAGYLVPAAHAAWVAAKLRAHGLRFRALGTALRDVPVEAFRASDVSYAKPFEGRPRIKIQGAWRAEKHSLAAGSLFVPIDQPRAYLVLHLLDPTAPDSLVQWGYFNAMFEQKEYMEEYVLEAEARRMLARDPKLKEEFERRMRDDAKFAADPEQRLRFFYLRHPAVDDRIDLVPVLRVDRAP
jgi:hypothetical protein